MSVSDTEIIDALSQHGSQRKAAKALGIHSRTIERRLSNMAPSGEQSRLLVIDIETSPNIAYTWGLWNQNVAISQLIEPGRVLCFAAKWHGETGTQFHAEWRKGEHEGMIRAAHRLLCEADGVVGWNSKRFDLRWLNDAFYMLGLRKPSGYKNVDLMLNQRRDRFLASNKLQFARQRQGGGKLDTGGFQLWRDVLAGDKKARKLMEEYNRQDVEETDAELSRALKGGWVKGLPNMSITHGDACPHCGSRKLKAQKPYLTATRMYRTWLCLDCETTSRDVRCLPSHATLREVA